jgi:N-hydroxyarylamine O-acetyltransferase
MSIRPLSAADLAAYFARIDYNGPVNADLATLRALCAAHARAIPFENIEVQQGLEPSIEVDALVEKLVRQGRGGWCYEQNGLFGSVLAGIGFDVMRIGGGGAHNAREVLPMGAHLTLLVQLDRPWIADVGFGSWLSGPVPVEEGTWRQAPFTISMTLGEGGLWRLAAGTETRPASSYEFTLTAADEEQMTQVRRHLASAPQSIFVQNLLAQRHGTDCHYALRGRILVETDADGERQTVLESPDALLKCLHDVFGLDVPNVRDLWTSVCARHDELFGN